jgi:hypothetical protein
MNQGTRVNITCNEESSMDIESKWFGSHLFITLRFNHDDLGISHTNMNLSREEVEDVIQYLTNRLNHQRIN